MSTRNYTLFGLFDRLSKGVVIVALAALLLGNVSAPVLYAAEQAAGDTAKEEQTDKTQDENETNNEETEKTDSSETDDEDSDGSEGEKSEDDVSDEENGGGDAEDVQKDTSEESVNDKDESGAQKDSGAENTDTTTTHDETGSSKEDEGSSKVRATDRDANTDAETDTKAAAISNAELRTVVTDKHVSETSSGIGFNVYWEAENVELLNISIVDANSEEEVHTIASGYPSASSPSVKTEETYKNFVMPHELDSGEYRILVESANSTDVAEFSQSFSNEKRDTSPTITSGSIDKENGASSETASGENDDQDLERSISGISIKNVSGKTVSEMLRGLSYTINWSAEGVDAFDVHLKPTKGAMTEIAADHESTELKWSPDNFLKDGKYDVLVRAADGSDVSASGPKVSIKDGGEPTITPGTISGEERETPTKAPEAKDGKDSGRGGSEPTITPGTISGEEREKPTKAPEAQDGNDPERGPKPTITPGSISGEERETPTRAAEPQSGGDSDRGAQIFNINISRAGKDITNVRKGLPYTISWTATAPIEWVDVYLHTSQDGASVVELAKRIAESELDWTPADTLADGTYRIVVKTALNDGTGVNAVSRDINISANATPSITPGSISGEPREKPTRAPAPQVGCDPERPGCEDDDDDDDDNGGGGNGGGGGGSDDDDDNGGTITGGFYTGGIGGGAAADLKVTDASITRANPTTAIVKWSTNKDATSRVVYGRQSVPESRLASAPRYGYESNTIIIDADNKREHSLIVFNLDADSTYYFRAVSTAASDRAFSEELTLRPGDAQASCSYITTSMRVGADNEPFEVTKLQTFLKNFEGFDVGITGIYDQATANAVTSFQERYASDVLAPWGRTTGTGTVHITTRNKINEIVCGGEISLTGAELAEIQTRSTGTSDGSRVNGVGGPVGQADGEPAGETDGGDSGGDGIEIGTSSEGTENGTAATSSVPGINGASENWIGNALLAIQGYGQLQQTLLALLIVLLAIYAVVNILIEIFHKNTATLRELRPYKLNGYIIGVAIAAIASFLLDLFNLMISFVVVLVVLIIAYLWTSYSAESANKGK